MVFRVGVRGDMTDFEAFYYDYIKDHPKTPKWQIEDAYDARCSGHRVYDPNRWRFLKKKRD